MVDVEREIERAVNTGKVFFGFKSALKGALEGRVKLIVLARNSPEEIKKKIEHYSKLSNVPVMVYSGSGRDLGEVCRKPFMVSALSIREIGDSKIMEVLEGRQRAEE
ncbi:MAG: 50S ribosomal protein L30e [Candidatus Bathyarchaeia archaeon]